MLNRRILRVKALQSLYSYYISKKSLRKVIAQKLADKYELDPAVHDFADKPFFEKRKELLKGQFYQAIDGQTVGHPDLQKEELEEVNDFSRKYANEVSSEHVSIRKQMLEEVLSIHDTYLKLLLLPSEFAFIEKQELEKIEKSITKSREVNYHYHLIENPVIEALSTFEKLQKEAIQKKIDWKAEHEEVRNWYREVLKKDEKFLDYQAKKEPSLEEHRDIVQHIMKKLVFKSESIENFFNGRDLHWEENRISLRSMVTKTIKSFEPELDDPFEMIHLSKNEEDDMDFFKKLFNETIRKDAELEDIIAQKTKNWDLSRIAATDKIILKMALTEMMSFPSIPVKVTINEFIEISKNYSTPKSKQFINGILDVLANELTSEGVIKKSGRGLIDNK